jgi:hypothetical protein
LKLQNYRANYRTQNGQNGGASIATARKWKKIGTSLITGKWTGLKIIQGDQKVSVHLMITIQKATSNVQSVPRQSPDIY